MHYFPIYEEHLAPFRGRRCTLLEIGVSHGGSLQMWRHFLGRKSHIVGIDIEPRIAELAEKGIWVHVGDQSDPSFLDAVTRQHGPWDMVIDDGSHHPAHQIASIEALWPDMADGGRYIVEDLHTNYWAEYGGGPGSATTFMAWLAQRIDDMNAFHSHTPGFDPNDWTRSISSIHVYDSVAVLVKARREPPFHRKTGRPSFPDVYGTPFESVVEEDHLRQLASLNRPMARLRRLRRDPVGTLRRAVARLRP